MVLEHHNPLPHSETVMKEVTACVTRDGVHRLMVYETRCYEMLVEKSALILEHSRWQIVCSGAYLDVMRMVVVEEHFGLG